MSQAHPRVLLRQHQNVGRAFVSAAREEFTPPSLNNRNDYAADKVFDERKNDMNTETLHEVIGGGGGGDLKLRCSSQKVEGPLFA